MSRALRMACMIICVIYHDPNHIDYDRLIGRHNSVWMTFHENPEILCSCCRLVVDTHLLRRHLVQILLNNLSRILYW